MAKINKMLVGESLVGEGNEVAHIDLIIGPRGSAAELAFANALVNNKDGFTTLLAVVAPNLLCKPATILFNKVTIKGRQAGRPDVRPGPARRRQGGCRFGRRRRDPGRGSRRSVHLGRRVHPLGCRGRQKIQDYNYAATKEAIARAVAGEPKAAEVVAKRNDAKHPFAAN